MNKIKYILLTLLIATACLANENIHQNHLVLKFDWLAQSDSYLSSLNFEGKMIEMSNEWRQHFFKKNTKLNSWLNAGYVNFGVGILHNQPFQNNSILCAKAKVGWQAFYKKQFFKNFNLFGGVGIDFDGNFRNIASNVNKPFSMDAGLDNTICGKLDYTFGKKKSYRVEYKIENNVFGADYLPDFWQGYFETHNVKNNIRFASLQNRINFYQSVQMIFLLKKIGLAVGVEHHFHKTEGKNILMQRQSINIVFNIIFNYQHMAVNENF